MWNRLQLRVLLPALANVTLAGMSCQALAGLCTTAGSLVVLRIRSVR